MPSQPKVDGQLVEFLPDGEFKMSLNGEENLAVYKITCEEWEGINGKR